ncbi:DUF3822 family protein [Pedobacter polaris]|uniref:DUF3822 family protein n=1 Tax=Pedobacter polaris TaxID=2571273 RepID=A0A4U1CXB0_9SPHI|nr:DUF3822 family protein [Pedobacter polaris]TKC10728.1 DUF3822 family protein [Pedobacter polaris]
MDNKNSILLIDPTFDPASAPSCNLLVKVGSKSFSYAIVNTETKKVNAVFDEQECENGAKKLIDRLKTDIYLGLPYQEVKIAVHTPNSIAIPLELYTADNLSSNAQFFTENHSGNLYVAHQSHFGFNTIFSLPTNTDEAINFASGKKYHENAGLLALAEQMKETALVLDFTVGSLSIIYLNNNQIIFQQSYEIDDIQEFNYYLLVMINQLNINASCNIYLTGIVHKNDEKYNCLLKYFNTIQFLTINNSLDQQVLDDMPAHYYSSLLALYQCG